MSGEFYKMEFRAWNLGTVDLTLEQEAAYLRLCHAMYDAHGPIPNSTRLLQSIFRCGNTKANALVKQLIGVGKIAVTADGSLINHRVTEELANRERVSSARRVAGERGGTASGVTRSKSLNNNDADEAIASTDRSREEKRREEKNTPEANASVPKGTPRNRKPKGTLCPDDLRPNEAHYSHCEREGVPRAFADEMCRRMQSWSHENANREVAWKSDWLKALHNFIDREIGKRRAETASPRASPPRGRAPSSQDHFLRLSAENHHEMTGASDDEGPFDDSAGPLFGSGGQGYGGGGRSDLGFDARVRQLPPRRDPRSLGPH